MKLKKILIIEDDESIGEAVVAALEFEGFEPKHIIDAKLAITTVRSFKPDIILLDLLLSGVDGRDIAAVLKKHPVYKKIPIVLTSAHPTAEQVAKDAGIEGFIAKPFDIGILCDTLKSLMRAKE